MVCLNHDLSLFPELKSSLEIFFEEFSYLKENMMSDEELDKNIEKLLDKLQKEFDQTSRFLFSLDLLNFRLTSETLVDFTKSMNIFDSKIQKITEIISEINDILESKI